MLTADTVRHVLRWETFHVHKDSPQQPALRPLQRLNLSCVTHLPHVLGTRERGKKGCFHAISDKLKVVLAIS